MCLKIRGLGVDTGGTLDALSSVLFAASKGGVEGGADAEDIGCKTDVFPGAVAETGDARGELDESERDSDSDAQTAPIPGDTQGDVGCLASETGGEASPQQMIPAAASSGPPDLWSLEFAYPELERALQALETAVTGLVFVVCAASNLDADREASALW